MRELGAVTEPQGPLGGVIPVVNHEGAVVGMVTDRDLCMAAYTQGKPLGEIPVSTAMARDVFGCRPQDSIESVEHLMRDKHIRRVPVIDAEGRLVGLISLNDIVRDAAARGRNSSDRQLTRTMAFAGALAVAPAAGMAESPYEPLAANGTF